MKLASKEQYVSAMQKMRDRLANRPGVASKPTPRAPVAPPTGGGGGGGMPSMDGGASGDRMSTMPVGKPIPFNPPGDRVSTMPVGKPIPFKPDTPRTGGVMPPPPLPGKDTRPVGSVPNTRAPMTPSATPVGGARPQMIAKGGKAKEKKYASGGMAASKRADGIAQRGKTKCKMY